MSSRALTVATEQPTYDELMGLLEAGETLVVCRVKRQFSNHETQRPRSAAALQELYDDVLYSGYTFYAER